MMGWGHGWGHGFGHMWGMGGGTGILGALGSLLGLFLILGFLALLALAAIWLLRRNQTASYAVAGGQTGAGNPLDLAKLRLAKGEMTLAEYDRIRSELSG